MMRIKIQYLFIWMNLVAVTLAAQEVPMERADGNYEKYAYIDAIGTYERLAHKGYSSPELLKRLANSYYFNAKLVEAHPWYEKLFTAKENLNPEYYYRYSQTLKAVGDYPRADEMLKAFHDILEADARGKLFMEQQDYLEEISKNSGRYKLENAAGLNSQYSDYGSAIHGDSLIFATTRDQRGFSKNIHSWNNHGFADLYWANSGETSMAPKKMKAPINSKFHEASPVFSQDGKTMYFTRNNFIKGDRGHNRENITLLKLYRASLEKGRWGDLVSMPFNSDQYSVAHPSLDPEEKFLYFASDMPGTLGDSDIYRVAILPDGGYGEPENLGDWINTPGRETFPFVSSANELYFSTDGRPGLGGLDIFVVSLDSSGVRGKIRNIGEPANSPHDDFALVIDPETGKGYLSSNRPGGLGDDDIYAFTQLEALQPECEQALAGTLLDTDGEHVSAVRLVLYNERMEPMGETLSDAEGGYGFQVECGKGYFIKAEKIGYQTVESKVEIPERTGTTEHPIVLENTLRKLQVGDDLAQAFGLEAIYFDLNHSNIRNDAEGDLRKILDVLEQHPGMTLDIRSHTDSRQTHKYNEWLSERRARSTMAWLVKHGVSPSRITGRGYGETQLVNACADGVSCSEEAHQKNRRSEFIITGI